MPRRKLSSLEISIAINRLRNKELTNLAELLLNKVTVLEDKGCWVLNEDWSRYSSLNKELGHRLSYRLFKGELVLFILHKCDRKGCVNYDHLFQDNQSENARDWRRKKKRANIDSLANKLLWSGKAKAAMDTINSSETRIKRQRLDERRNVNRLETGAS